MATNNHRLSTHSYQEPLHCVCHISSNYSCHPLSKSSSNLLSSGSYGSDATQSSKQELRKSLSSNIVCQTQARENSMPSSRDSLWSPVRNGMVASPCATQPMGTRLPAEDAQMSNFLTVERSPASWDGSDRRIRILSGSAEDAASVGEAGTAICKTQSADPLEAVGALVQKSHSEFLHSCNDPSPVMHHRTSATYSDFCPANSVFETAARDPSFQSQICEFTRNQNAQNRTEKITFAREQNASPVSFGSDTIQHNITVYTSPGTFHPGDVRQHECGNAFLDNRIMTSHSTGSIMCGTTCNNNACTVHLPIATTMYDSCAMHCHIKNEPVPAYCHSFPIPAIQLAPRLACASVNQSGRERIAPGYCLPLPLLDMVTFPKLACSISESGLDAKRFMRCGGTPGEQSPLLHTHSSRSSSPEPNRTELQMHASVPSFNVEMGTKTKDTGTMTTMDNLAMIFKPTYEFKDAEVQTVAVLETKSVATSPSPLEGDPTHVFPEVSLKMDLQCSQTPVREVRWDDEGMTWEVYGASVDPEVLGLAIQKHLEIQIEEHLKPAESPRKNSGVHSSKEEKRRSFRTMMYSLRRSSCCARSSAVVE